MSRILTIGGLVLLLAVGLFVAVVSSQPSEMHIERSATFDAVPSDVFPHINDLEKTQVWSPWAERDPNMEVTYSESKAGVGASYRWEGNDEVGSGTQTIVESVANEKVVTALEFQTPFASNASATMLLMPVGDEQTEISWSLDAESGFMDKLVGMMFDMDALVGADYEHGLARLREVAEASAEERRVALADAEAEAEAALAE
ncbi:MAG: SRPBCC family protein, partial [Myxococcota bacterium]